MKTVYKQQHNYVMLVKTKINWGNIINVANSGEKMINFMIH
jgi:hypothetical protein